MERKINKITIRNSEPILTGNIIGDTVHKCGYKKLSRKQEQDMIKKSKLSFYSKVNEKRKKQYLDYYFEYYPKLKKEYERLEKEIEGKVQEVQKAYEDTKIKGKYPDIKRIKQLRAEIEKLEKEKDALIKRCIDASKQIRDIFLLNNQRLVASIVLRYRTEVPNEDLFSEGNIGMIKALENFNTDKNVKFSTYATKLIKQKIALYLKEKSNIIKTPAYFIERLNNIYRINDEFQSTHNRKPTIQEIAENSGYTVEEIENTIDQFKLCRVNISLNELTSADAEDELIEFIVDDSEDFSEEVLTKMTAKNTMKLFEELDISEKAIEVLKMRYGVDDGIPKTTKEISDKLGLRKERIRQIEVRALNKIRRMEYTKKKERKSKQKIIRFNGK